MTTQDDSRPVTTADLRWAIGQLRADMDWRFRLLMWGILIGFAAVLAVLGALLAQGG